MDSGHADAPGYEHTLLPARKVDAWRSGQADPEVGADGHRGQGVIPLMVVLPSLWLTVSPRGKETFQTYMARVG